ncbi:MAG: hypothetical protein ACI8RP_000748 [Urechidicola sp.]|jgi:hypothetical protein
MANKDAAIIIIQLILLIIFVPLFVVFAKSLDNDL